MSNYVNKMIDHDPSGFDGMYIHFKDRVTSILRSMLRVGRLDAEDLYCRACYELYRACEDGVKIKDSIPDKNLSAYLIRTARNIWLKENKRKHLSLDESRNAAIENTEDPLYECKMDFIYATVLDMPMPCSSLLMLKHFDHCSSDEIARRMNYANGDSAKNQLARCMKKLKTYIIKSFREKNWL